MEQVGQEMPKYKCHKEVWALKIMTISRVTGRWLLLPVDKNYTSFEVTKEYIDKHDPQVGGYYVVYEDGYKSFSPADAFEKGYTKKE